MLAMMTQGVFFDVRSIRKLPVSKDLVTRTLRALTDARVILRSEVRGKYYFTDEFTDLMKQIITPGMPLGLFVHYPDLGVFDVSGIEHWTGEEMGYYVRRLRERWKLRAGIPNGA